MKKFALLALCAAGIASAQTPVSVYDFNGSLFPVYNRDGLAGPLEHRAKPTDSLGVRSPSIVLTPVFQTATVGSASRQVGKFLQDTDGDLANGLNMEFYRVYSGVPSSGGGAYGNQYTIVMDVRVDALDVIEQRWGGFYNTTADQNNDSDLFLDLTRGYGISGNYEGVALFAPATFQRVAIVCDLTQVNGVAPDERMRIYVNGSYANSVPVSGLDGRFALYSPQTGITDGYTHFDIFGDEDLEAMSGAIAQLAVFDSALSASQVAALGSIGSNLAPAQVLVNGTLALGDYNGDVDTATAGVEYPAPAQLPIQVLDGNGNVVGDYAIAQVNEIGQISVPLPGAGTFEIRVNTDAWRAINQFALTTTTFLSESVIVTATSGNPTVTINLRNGDVNNDGEVGPADFSTLAGAFGTFFGDSNYLLEADLNKDGEVGPADFALLTTNFGEFGDF